MSNLPKDAYIKTIEAKNGTKYKVSIARSIDGKAVPVEGYEIKE